MKGSVVQPWLSNLSFKQQAVLLSALRGCDGIQKEDVSKHITRFLRGFILNAANAEDRKGERGSYMTKSVLDEDLNQFVKNLDHYPNHFITHLMHAIEIVGYNHPDISSQMFWRNTYFIMVKALHLHPESKEENDLRLMDED